MKTNAWTLFFYAAILVLNIVFINNESHSATNTMVDDSDVGLTEEINIESCIVSFNRLSKIFHNPACEWAEKCTKNCITISRDKAISKNGTPCKVCKGSCE